MQRSGILFLVLALILACQVVPTPPPLRATPRAQETATPVRTAYALPTQTTPEKTSTSPSYPTQVPGELPALIKPGREPFAPVQLSEWESLPIGGEGEVALPAPPEAVTNLAASAGLTSRQREALFEHGFVILHSQESQFSEIRERVSWRYGQPYYLTVDAASHALRTMLQELEPALEREELHRRLLAVTQSALNQTLDYLQLVKATELEADTRLAAAYLGVAVSLLDPESPIDPEIEALVKPQLEQVLSGRGVQRSRLFPEFQDDYRAYLPGGHYAGDPELEAYFRGKTWLGRVHFGLPGTETAYSYARLPLIVTLALRQASTETGSAALEWIKIQQVLAFLSGPGSSVGPAEYAGWMDQVYGRNQTILSLQDASRWETFRALIRNVPVERPGFTLAQPASATPLEQSWSFIGESNNLGEMILQNLRASRAYVPEEERLQPGGLEIMAVLGSQTALDILDASGEKLYRTDMETIADLRDAVQAQTQTHWLSNAPSAWLYALQPLLKEKGGFEPAIFPAALRTPAWAYKDLNTALGSFVELRHDRLRSNPIKDQTSQVSDGLISPPTPGYVEPNPQVFYRLAHLALTLVEGLKQREMTGVFTTDPGPSSLSQLLTETLDLADRLQRLGDIAAKELSGLPLDASDNALIQAPLGLTEKRALSGGGVGKTGQSKGLPSVAVIERLAEDGERNWLIGTGFVDRIYVLIPGRNGLAIAQGGVYSHHELSLPRDRIINDTAWNRMLVNDPPQAPAWLENLYLPEGNAVDMLAYRIGDIYRTIPSDTSLRLHESPHKDARVSRMLLPGEVVKIIEGPVSANGLTWWKIQVDPSQTQPFAGWLVESQTGLERVWSY